MADSAAGSPRSEARSASEMRQILDHAEEPLDHRSRARVHREHREHRDRGSRPPLDLKRPRLSLDSTAESLDSCGSSRTSGDSQSVHSEGGAGVGGDLARSRKMVDNLLRRVQRLEAQRDKARDDAIKQHAWVKKIKPQLDDCIKLKEKILQLKPLQAVNAKLVETVADLEKEKICRLDEMANLKAQFSFLDQQLQAAFKANVDAQQQQQNALQEARQEARREGELQANKARDVEVQRLQRQLRDLNGRIKNELEPEMTTLLLEEQTFNERLEQRDKVLLLAQTELQALQRRVRDELEPQLLQLREHHSEREVELQVELDATRTELVRYQERQRRTLKASKKLAEHVKDLKQRLSKVCAERDRLKEEIASQAAEAQGREDEARQREDERVRQLAADATDLQQRLEINQEACKSLLNCKRDLMLQLAELKAIHAECPRFRPPSRDRSPSMPLGVPLPARLRQPDLLTTYPYSPMQESELSVDFERGGGEEEGDGDEQQEEHQHLLFEVEMERVPVIKTEPADED